MSPEPAHHPAGAPARRRPRSPGAATPHVRRPLGTPAPGARRPVRPWPHQRGRRRSGDARGPPGPPRSRRQLQGRQGLHRPGARARHRRRGARQPECRAAGREDRQRRADRAALRRRSSVPPVREPSRRRDGRPPGIGQDHLRRQARPPRGQAGAAPDARRGGPVPSGRDRAAPDPREGSRHPGLQRPGRDLGPGDRPAEHRGRAPRGPRHADPRHRGPPQHRRGPHGRGDRPGEGGQARRDPPRRGRHGRPRGRQRRPGLPRGGPADRPGADEDRRRRARRRCPVDQCRDGPPGEVPGHGREDGRAGALPSRPLGRANPRDGRRADTHRAGPGRLRREGGGEGSRQAPVGQLHARGHAGAAAAGQEDGAARTGHRDDPGHGRDGQAGRGFDQPGRSQADRGDHPVDDARRAPGSHDPQRKPSAAHLDRFGHLHRGGQPAREAARRDAEAHEADCAGVAGFPGCSAARPGERYGRHGFERPAGERAATRRRRGRRTGCAADRRRRGRRTGCAADRRGRSGRVGRTSLGRPGWRSRLARRRCAAAPLFAAGRRPGHGRDPAHSGRLGAPARRRRLRP